MKCPIDHRYDPFDREAVEEPHELFGELRAQEPAWYLPSVDHYLVTRYDDIVAALGDRETWSAANASAVLIRPCPAAQAVLDEGFHRVPTLNNSDPPRHGLMRRSLNACMTPKRQLAMETDLRAYCRALIDEVAGEERFDLVDRIAFQFPGWAAFHMLGFPDEDIEQLKEWGHIRVMFTYGRLGDDEQVAAAHQVVAMWNYAGAHVARRQQELSDDLTSDLLRYSAEHPEVLTTFDIHNMVYSLALAGHETTCNAIGNAVLSLLRHRDQWDRLIADPSLCANAADETLRFDGPVISQRRIAKVDAEIGESVVPEGGRTMLCFASANRDPARFDRPDELDVERPDASAHLSFGKGAHFCLGAPLARLEIRIVLELLTERMPRLQLVEDQDLEHVPNVLFRGVRQLWVRPNLA